MQLMSSNYFFFVKSRWLDCAMLLKTLVDNRHVISWLLFHPSAHRFHSTLSPVPPPFSPIPHPISLCPLRFIVGILITHRRFGLPNSWRNFFLTIHVCRRRPSPVSHPTSGQFHPLVLTTHVAVRIVHDKHVHLLLQSINVSCFYLAMILRLLCLRSGTLNRNWW